MSKLLITGGTGSFGTTALERFTKDSRYTEIVVFSRDEKKQFDLMQDFPPPRVRYFIGDTRNYDSIRRAMEGVNIVFHAAALKQVPTGEFFPMELVRTNILGTENVFRAAREAGVQKVVFLSTDKAVYPINVMGMTKALAEKLMTAFSFEALKTTYTAVRYGNVMASRGSVIPLFVEQIRKGKDITVTNPAMTRFMLSLDDAIGLVDFAVENGTPGDIFVRKAPAATIGTLANVLVDIFKSKSAIRIVGTRKGEKVHETLASGVELMQSVDLGDFFRIKTGGEMRYDAYFEKGDMQKVPEDYTSATTKILTQAELRVMLENLPYIKAELSSRT